jgi:class 3 adenylate cyclase
MPGVNVPETRYAKTPDGVHIAYQLFGEGPMDLVFVYRFVSNLAYMWEIPQFARFLRRLGGMARVLALDPRGAGMSDRVPAERMPSLEVRMEDVRTVMDAVGWARAAFMGTEHGGTLCALFAATYPERTNALVLYATFARGLHSQDYPWGWTEEQFETWLEAIDQRYGDREWWSGQVREVAPSLAHDEEFVRRLGTYYQLCASPDSVIAVERMAMHTDIRAVLPTIQAPTLVLHREGDLAEPSGQGSYVADRIPGARFVPLPGEDHEVFAGDQDALLDEVEKFLATVRNEEAAYDRVLATVLFTDIVGSTERAATLGDRAWREVLDRHHAVVRAMLGRNRGKEIKTIGDGFLATFDGPARAIRCAQSIAGEVARFGIEIRAGLHTGEIDLLGEDVGGMAVNIAARVASLAGPSEVLVSSTVKDLVAGSDLVFDDGGEHELKGVPDRWRLYRVVG